jgi:hypothetical protein
VAVLAGRVPAIGPTSASQRHPGWKTKRLTAISSSITISTRPFVKRRTSSGPPKPCAAGVASRFLL